MTVFENLATLKLYTIFISEELIMLKSTSSGLAFVLLLSMPLFAETEKASTQKAAPAKASEQSKNSTQNDLNTNINISQLSADGKRIDFVHMSELMASSTPGKAVMKELEEQKNMFAKEINEKQQKIAQAEKTLQEKAPTMNPAAQSSESRKIETQKEDLSMLARRKEAEFKDNYMIKTEELFKQAHETVVQVAQAEAVDAVVDAESGRVLYLSNGMNSTGKYLAQLEKNHAQKVAKNKATTKSA